MTQIPAGWYPDPAPAPPGQPPGLRYWDGNVWTEHVAPDAAQPVAPQPVYQQPVYQQRAYQQPAYQQPAPVGATTPDGQPLAGWWWRVLALLIDSVVVGVVSGIISLPAQISMQKDLSRVIDDFRRSIDANPDATPEFSRFFNDYVDVLRDNALWLILPGLVAWVLYYLLMLRYNGATLGKLAVGLRVRLRDQPGQLPWSAVVIRVSTQFLIPYLLLGVGLFSGSLVLLVVLVVVYQVYSFADVLWPLGDSKKQALHDKFAGTNVVKIR